MALNTRATEPPSGQDALEVRERYFRKQRSPSADSRWRVAGLILVGGVACWACVAGLTVFLLGS